MTLKKTWRQAIPHEYKVWDTVNFGKYKGMQVQHICMQNSGYINWLIENTFSFYLSDESIDMLEVVNSNFNLSNKAKENLVYKQKILRQEHH